MSEDLKEPETETVECAHDQCVVITHQMVVEFREHGEVHDTQSKLLSTTHGEHSIGVFLNMLGDMSNSVFEEAAWVMQHFGLPPEVVSLACQGNIKVEVREMPHE